MVTKSINFEHGGEIYTLTHNYNPDINTSNLDVFDSDGKYIGEIFDISIPEEWMEQNTNTKKETKSKSNISKRRD